MKNVLILLMCFISLSATSQVIEFTAKYKITDNMKEVKGINCEIPITVNLDTEKIFISKSKFWILKTKEIGKNADNFDFLCFDSEGKTCTINLKLNLDLLYSCNAAFTIQYQKNIISHTYWAEAKEIKK